MPSRSKIHGIWRAGFYIHGWTIVRTIALRWVIFKQKKESATICLGLIYWSMDSSQPPTPDTVPLKNFHRTVNPQREYKQFMVSQFPHSENYHPAEICNIMVRKIVITFSERILHFCCQF
jgi:hypothetical protein